MNLKSVTNNYRFLSLRERFSLYQSAVCRLDENEMDAIMSQSPKESYRIPDLKFFVESVFYLHHVNLMERLNYQVLFDCFNESQKDREFCIRLTAYLYVIETDAWMQVGEEFGFNVMDWRERMAKDSFVCQLLELHDSWMRKVAFTEKQLEKGRVKLLNSDGKLKDIEKVKERYRAVLRRSE